MERRLAAILAADVVGYSRLMGGDEAGTLDALKTLHKELVAPQIADHKGRIVKLMGDGLLAEFGSVVNAVECAVAIQTAIMDRGVGKLSAPELLLRIGINLGDVIVEGRDIYGDGVNVASRLEGLAEPGGVCVSGAVYDAIGNKLSLHFDFLGEQRVKNIEKPVRTYSLLKPRSAAGRRSSSTRASNASALEEPDNRPSLAIKPFETFGPSPDLESIANGMTDGLVVALMKLHGLALIGDTSPSMAVSRQMTVEELARRMHVRFVLKGGIRKHGDRVRVNAELMEVSTGRYLWADQYDRFIRDFGDLFAIQDEIIEEIVSTLDVKLLSGEAGRLVRKEFTNPEALESYYRGEQLLWHATTRVEFVNAQGLLEETIRLQPTVSVGYANAAVAYWLPVFFGLSDAPSVSLDRAAKLARQALCLNDLTGYPHLVLAEIHLSRREFDEAIAEADQAVLTRPSCPASYSLKAAVLNYLGRPAEAIEYATYAVRLTPFYPPLYPAILATAYYGAGMYEDAIKAAKAAIDLAEDSLDANLVLAASNVTLGHTDEALLAAKRIIGIMPDFGLKDFAGSQPYQDKEHLDRLMVPLKLAGLPE